MEWSSCCSFVIFLVWYCKEPRFPSVCRPVGAFVPNNVPLIVVKQNLSMVAWQIDRQLLHSIRRPFRRHVLGFAMWMLAKSKTRHLNLKNKLWSLRCLLKRYGNMSWLKAAGNYASGAMKAATSIVAPPSQRSTRSQLRDHITYIRSFAESSEQVIISSHLFERWWFSFASMELLYYCTKEWKLSLCKKKVWSAFVSEWGRTRQGIGTSMHWRTGIRTFNFSCIFFK